MDKLCNFIIGAIVLIALVILLGVCGKADTTYTRYGYIDTIEDNNVLVIVDTTGNEWDYQSKDFNVGDEIKMKMFNNFTDGNIYDDKIESIEKR